MSHKPFLMGSENEYSVAVNRSGARRRPPAEKLAQLLLGTVAELHVCLPDTSGSGGAFLQNGARFYVDINGHPECCTPECSTPEQIAVYDKAGERILLRLAERVRKQQSVEMTVVKNNLTSVLPDTATFGNHESYVSWVELGRAAEALIPHLVSRLPYAGAGCLSADPAGGGFELSQRARHLVRDVGTETTHDRAIFCTRVRNRRDASCDGWTRAHLISKDSHRSPLGNYLTFGTTGLLFWILNEGGAVGQTLKLTNAVQALRLISRDPYLQAHIPLADGRKLTALEIQHEYLAECERFAAGHEVPDWAAAVLQRWRETLDQLARNPIELATRLDSYAKLLLLDHEVRRSGFSWEQVRDALRLVDDIRRAVPDAGLLRALIEEEQVSLPPDKQAAFDGLRSRIDAAGREAMDRVRFALRLQVLDLKYHELGGLYDHLAREGHMEQLMVSERDIDRAVAEPPPGGRAAARSALIREYASKPGWVAGWGIVLQQGDQSHYDLSDPFSDEPKFVPPTVPSASDESAAPAAWSHLRRLMSF